MKESQDFSFELLISDEDTTGGITFGEPIVVNRKCHACSRWIHELFQYCPHCGELQKIDFLYDYDGETHTWTLKSKESECNR